MSRQSFGQVAGGIIGGALGFFAGGNVALGFSIGSSIGGYLTAPDVSTQGPRLSDNATSRSSYGVGIPRLFGAMSLPEIRIWSSGLIEHATTEEVGGKGGPTVEHTTFSYTASWASLLCEGPITGIRRIRFDGRLVYDLRDTADAQAVYASIQLATGLTLYVGNETQTVDPTIEAAVGVGNASAYRGWCYLVFNNIDVTKYGHIPFVEVEAYTTGSEGTDWVLVQNTDPGVNFGSNTPRVEAFGLYEIDAGTAKTYDIATGTVYTLDINGNVVDEQPSLVSQYPDEPGIGHFHGVPLYANDMSKSLSSTFSIIATNSTNTRDGFDLSSYIPDSAGYVIGIAVSVDESSIFVLTAPTFLSGVANAWYMLDQNGLLDNGTIDAALSLGWPGFGVGSRAWNWSENAACVMESDRIHIWRAYGAAAPNLECYEIDNAGVLRRIISQSAAEHNFYYASVIADDGFAWVTMGTLVVTMTRHPRHANTDYDLADLVSANCNEVGLVAADYDVTDLVGTGVEGYSISRQMTARAAIQPLQQAYFFDVAEIGGKLVFVSRGGASAATLTTDDLGAFEESSTGQERLTITRGSDNELPRRVTVNYLKPGDYEVGSQYDSRQIGVQSAVEIAVELPLVLSDEIAVRAAEVLLFEAWKNRERVRFSTNNTALNPADVITIEDEGETYTLRLLSVDIAGAIGPMTCEAVMEDASLYSPVSVGAPTTGSDQVLSLAGPTRLEIIDGSLLRANDGDDGVYLAASGYYSGWPGCVVMRSQDNANWSQWASITSTATIGRADTLLGTADSTVYDLTNSLTVTLISGSLASVAELAWLNGENTALVGDEVVLFQTATQVDADTWTISNLIRGARGTEWAIGIHAIGERFVALDPASLVRATLSQDVIGLTQYLRAVTLGASLETGAESDFDYAANAYKTFAPAHLTASDNGDGTFTATWVRRTRKGGEWRDYVGVTLVEDTELYRVEVWRTGALLSTVDVTSATATVTAITTDIIKVAQVSAVIGAGNQSEITL